MKDRRSFYIGWQENMSSNHAKFLRPRLILILGVIILLPIVIVAVQRPFNDYQYELGKLTTVTGVLWNTPFPILIADEGQLPEGLSKEILLVGYGKFGARGIISEIEKTKGELGGRHITLIGTLLFGDGKTLLELTKEEKSLQSISERPLKTKRQATTWTSFSGFGEILDPKCYFGVMKPGEGKIHKSCAIRCISGGIPPVFRSSAQHDHPDQHDYYLIVGKNGQAINQELLPLVAENIELRGQTSKVSGWDVLYVDIDDLPSSLSR